MIPRNNSNFATNPTINVKRSRFNRNHEHKLTFNVGDIVPIYWDEVLPGDTKKLKTNCVMRLSTLIAPIMDNIKVEMMYYFVPMRLVWSHTKEFFGENTAGPWAQQVEYQIPQVTAPSGTGWETGTIADYLGVPTKVPGLSINALPFRCVAKIYDEWFRDENLQDPFNIPVDDNTTTGSNGDTYISDVVKGGKPFKAAKYFDIFTSALPYPQKGASVPLPISNVNLDEAPVYGDGGVLRLYYLDGENHRQGNLRSGSNYDVTFSNNTGIATGTVKNLGVDTKGALGSNTSGIYADLTGLNIGIGTINELRTAFQIQKYLEKDARGGTRYIEYLLSHFGVQSPDARLQRSEYLGGSYINLNINQVIQNSESGSTPQGNTAAYSLSSSSHEDFTKSFVEHGYIIGFAVARYNHSYQQGLAREWSRKTKYDFYDPLFANLGEFSIKNKEIYAQGSSVLNPDTGIAYDEEVFGYNEAWYEYRYKPSYISGEFRSNSTDSSGNSNTLDFWHLADDYSSMPYLSDSWISEDGEIVDRTLAVTSAVSNQILADFYFEQVDVRPMPVYSIPGLIDHH